MCCHLRAADVDLEERCRRPEWLDGACRVTRWRTPSEAAVVPRESRHPDRRCSHERATVRVSTGPNSCSLKLRSRSARSSNSSPILEFVGRSAGTAQRVKENRRSSALTPDGYGDLLCCPARRDRGGDPPLSPLRHRPDHQPNHCLRCADRRSGRLLRRERWPHAARVPGRDGGRFRCGDRPYDVDRRDGIHPGEGSAPAPCRSALRGRSRLGGELARVHRHAGSHCVAPGPERTLRRFLAVIIEACDLPGGKVRIDGLGGPPWFDVQGEFDVGRADPASFAVVGPLSGTSTVRIDLMPPARTSVIPVQDRSAVEEALAIVARELRGAEITPNLASM